MTEQMADSQAESRSPYDVLRREIIEGQVDHGATLVETALAKRLGVSRTPVREALKKLEQDGLIERHDRGLRVRTRSAEEILEIYEVRIVNEEFAARLAAQRRTPFDLARLQAAHDQMAARRPDSAAEQISINRSFHQALWRAAHNSTLTDQLQRLTDHVSRYSSTTLDSDGRWEEAVREHAAILEAVSNSDADAAASVASQHFKSARDIRLRMYASEELA